MRILVVDDEHLINRYIAQCIEEGMKHKNTVIRSEFSAARAKEAMQKERIDLVFLDITMPKMTGLELLPEIKAEYPETIVIMLTCHNEFEFVRRAMENNADGYVLKDELSPESIEKLIDTAVSKKKETNAERIIFQMKQQNFLHKLMDGFFERVDFAELREHKIFLDSNPFVALALEHRPKKLEALLLRLREMFENPVLYLYNPRIVVILMNIGGREIPDLNAVVKEGCEEEEVPDLFQTRIFYRINSLPEAIEEAATGLTGRFYKGEPVSEQYAGFSLKKRTERWIRMLDTARADLNAGKVKDYYRNLKELLAAAGGIRPDFYLLRSEIAEAVRELPNLRIGQNEMEAILNARSFAGLKETADALTRQGEKNFLPYSRTVGAAVLYLEQHYCEESISLSELGAALYVNAEYLSRQFKKETGSSFSEYLTRLRMEHAKELLENTSERISDIAMQVGIGNLPYFSTVFRKQYGISPKDLRKR